MASRMDEEREKQDSRVSVDYSRQHKTADRAVKQSSARKTNVAPQKVSSGGTMRSNTESRTGEGKSLVGNYERQHKTVEKRPVSSIRRSFTNYDSRNEFDPETLVGKSGRYWLAEISKIGERDREAGRELYDLYEQSKADVNSPLYDPYASATNTNPKYIQKNAAQTEKAKMEWQNLQKELSYWAQSDRNYSDEEILNRVNWKNYPTLVKMDADRAGEGSTVYLNEPIGYDQDAMYGVMWAARNPDLATGDTTMDAVLGTLGRGNQYQRDEQKAARLDPASRDYNPYLVGSTMDSQLQTYGVNGFGSDWLDQNLQYRGTDDYTKVYKAEQTTKKAEQELSELKERMNDLLDQGWTPEEVFTDDLLADYSTLQKLQNSIDNGSLIDTTRAIGYDRNAMQQAYQEAYTKRYGTKSNSEYAADTAAAMGVSVQQNEAQAMVDDAGDKKQKDYYQPIMQSGTDAEKNSVKAGTGTAGYNRTVAQVEESIQNGTAGAEGAAASKQLTVAQKTAPKYFEAMEAVKKGAEPDYSEELTAILNKAGVDAGEEDYTAKVAASLSQKAAEGDQEAAVMLNDWNSVGVEEYWEKQDSAETVSAYQAELEKIKQQWQDAFGGDTPEYRSHVNTMEVISSFSEKPKNDWSAYDVVTLANQQGVKNVDQVTASARSLNQQKIDYIDQILERADQYGVPKNYLENMQATREQLVRTNELIDSHSWKNNEDYAQAVEAFDASDMDTSYGAFTTGNEANTILLSVKDPEAAESALNAMKKTVTATGVLNQTLLYTTEMTEEERENFKYLYASQGQENAMAYYDDLRPMLSARYAAGESETAQEIGKEHPVTGTAMSIMASLAQMEGSLYTAYMALTGQQADPNSQWFSANRFVGSVREGVKSDLDTLAGDNEFAKQAFRFLYDGIVSSADSLVSAYAGNAIGSALPVLTAAEGAGKGAQLLAKGSQAIAGNVGLTMMSTVAASNAMQEALLKGVDPDKAFYAGLASGVAEAVTEKIPFDKITEAYKAGSKGGKIMKLLADNLIGEGLGEGMSEYLGAAGDYLVMGDDSDFIQSVNDYMADGMSEEAAIRQVASELNQQALYATLAGAFSGVVSSGGSYAAGRLANWYGRQEANQTVKERHDRRNREENSNEQTEVSANTAQIQNTEGVQEPLEMAEPETETEIPEQTELNQTEQAESDVERSAEPDAQNETAENVPENGSEKREETGDRAVEEEKTVPSNSAEEQATSAETVSKERTFDYDERLIIQDNRAFLAEQRNRVDQAQQNVEEARRALEELRRETSAAENELAMAEAAVDPALMQEVERLRNEASEIRNERSKASMKVQDAKDNYNRVKSDIYFHNIAEQQMKTAKEQIDSVTLSLNNAKARLSRAEENLEQKQTSVPALKKEQNIALEEARRKASEEEKTVEAKRSVLEETKQSYNALQEEAEKRQTEYEELQRQKKQLEEKRSSIYNERSEAQLRQDEDALERLIGEGEQIQRSINENAASIGRAERKVREAEKKAKVAKTNADAAAKELQVSEKAHSDADAEQKKIAASIEALDESLEDAKRVAERAKKNANQWQELVNGYNSTYQQAQKTVEGTNVSPDALEKAQAALDQRLEEVKSFETRQDDMERSLSEKEKALEESAAKKRDGQDKVIQLFNRYKQQRYELEKAEGELQLEQKDYEMFMDGLKRDYSAVDPEMYDAIIGESDPFQEQTSKTEPEENALTALYTAQQNGVGDVQQTASVDAALRSFGMEPETSVAVSKRMVETESTEKATAILEAAPNRQKAAQAIGMALLSPNSETAAVFADLNGQITAEDVNGLTQMYELDRLDDGAMGAYEAAIEESQLADETMAVLSQMDSGKVESARENAAKAQQTANQSGAKLEAANAGLEAAKASLETARQRRNENLNPETIAAESKALQQYGKAQEKQTDAEARYKADSKALKGAKEKVTAAQEEAVGQARSVALEQQKTRMEIKKVDYAVQQQNVDANIQQVAQMDSVVTLNGNEFEVGGNNLKNEVLEYFNQLGGSVHSEVLGDVLLTKRGVKDGLGHIISPAKVVAFAAVPNVLEKGKIVSAEQNWKGRGYDTVVLAAPISIANGEKQGDYIAGVVVKRLPDKQQYYVHDVVQINTKEGAQAPTNPRGQLENQAVVHGDAKAPSLYNILQNIVDVKRGKNASEKGAKRQNAAVSSRVVKTNSDTVIAADSKVTSPVDAAKVLAKTLNVGQDIGSRKVPRGVLGYYDTQAKYLAVRSTEAGNISTTMHELGHALSDKLSMTGTMQMVDALDPVFAQNYSANELPGEAFAEFMWRYMTDDASAQAFAGDAFLYDFERALKKNGLDRQVHKTRDQMHEYVNATVNQRIGAVVKDRSEKPKSSLKEIRTKLTDMLVDSTSVLEDVNNVVREQTGKTDVSMGENLRNTALLRNTASRRAYNMLTDTLTDSSWQSIGDGLAKRFENAGIKGKDFDLLNNYMLAMHSLDRDAAGKPVFDSSMTTEQREAYIQDVQQNHPEVARAEQEFQQFRNEFMQAFLVDTGYMTQETLDLFNKMYPHYVPTFRMKDGKGSGSGVSGKNFSIKRAKGSTENIYNPMDSFVQMMDSIVNMVSQNNTALVWDKVYHQYEGLGLYGREVTQDVQSESVDTTGLQDKIRKILEGANTDTDIMQQVMDTIGPEQVQWKGTGNVNLPNVLTVQKADGSKAYYEIFDTEMYNALSGYKETAGKVWQLIGKATKAMSALTTGSNPVFAIRNFLRDFQKSVTYGSWASNYVTGTGKWLRAAWDVWREKGEYGDYKALGGGGWNRIETGSRKGAEAYRGDLFKGYNTSNVGRTAKWAGQKIWNVVTFSRLNEVIEQTSRYAEYRYGKQDRTTAEGKQQAFLNAQEATVDFSRSGYSNIASDLKQVIPFLGASTQGIYQTGREFTTKAERSRLPARFAKTVINTALASVLANLLVFKHTDDDDKEEYAMLSDELLADNFFIPNPSAEIFGEAPYIRIPIGQDPIMRAVHGAVTNALWSSKVDDPIIELSAVAQNLLDGFNPVNGTIFDAAIATATNRNWYDSKIVPDRMDGWDPTTQYTEETADVFINASRWLDETVGVGVSPMMIQYLAEQYTGFLGQMAIPAISKDKYTGEMGGIKAALAAVRKRLTSDPLKSNGITSSFYDGVAELQEVTYAAKNERPLNMLRRGLTDDEARAAVDEAKSLTSTNGELGQAKKFLSDGYARIDEIEARTDLSDHEKYLMTSEIRREMMDNTLAAQELIGEYKAKYIDGENILSRLAEGVYGRESTAFEKLPERYLTAYQSGDGYMQRAYDAWETSGKASALPHANYTFTDKKVEYEVAEEDQEQFDSIYQDAYKQYVDRNTNDRSWERMTADEKLAFMQKAHEKAQTEAKKWWLKKKK